MERNVKYVSIGIVFLGIVIGFCVFVLWLGRFDFGVSKYKTYYILTQDETSAVGVNTPVKFKGIAVGKIDSVSFEDLAQGVIKITLSIDSNLEVREDSYISIASSGLAGANYLAFYQGQSPQLNTSHIIEFKKGGLDILLQKMQAIGDKGLSVLSGVSELTSPQTIENLQKTLLHLSQMSQDMAHIMKRLDSITASIDTNLQSGQYDFRSMLNPSLLQLQETLLQADHFFSKATHLVDKIEKNPYDSLFGKKRNSDE
ncbi:MlaD family protein [uncultured Helicobacter sp.]|uniref:MlaD family protein n=1 Tax=Helicobacter sp. TaxID=218 RepID=UPI002A798E35|nr:MlaD family protein [Helicobacter sp.]MDY2823037.1 MlaD family protein [Helicobacter sp.]